MAFPTPPDSVARLLTFKYGPRYMLWNLSEEAYEYSLFDNQVRPPSLAPLSEEAYDNSLFDNR